jgi:hypothetical protein
MRAARWHWLALFALFALCACSDGEGIGHLGSAPEYPVPGCEAFDPSPCDVRASSCQTRLYELAACLRGDEPGPLPVVSRMTQEQYVEYLNARIAMQPPPPEPNHFERALVLLGLARSGALGAQAAVSDLSEWVAGFYRADEQDIVIIDRAASNPERDSLILVHEFIHALQDRALGLPAFREAHAHSIDSLWTINAMIEGEARLHETRYGVSAFGLNPAQVDWQAHFQGAVELGEKDMLDAPSPYVASFRVFPYLWGARYLHFVWRAGGTAALVEQLAAPPVTTRVLMASLEQAAVEDFRPVAPSAPAAPESWTLVEEATLGAWGTFLILGRSAARETARAIAHGWRGDGLWIYANADAVTAVAWRAEFADEATAVAAERVLATRFEQGLVRDGTRLFLGLPAGVALDWTLSP